jgi:hypothetical protein
VEKVELVAPKAPAEPSGNGSGQEPKPKAPTKSTGEMNWQE